MRTLKNITHPSYRTLTGGSDQVAKRVVGNETWNINEWCLVIASLIAKQEIKEETGVELENEFYIPVSRTHLAQIFNHKFLKPYHQAIRDRISNLQESTENLTEPDECAKQAELKVLNAELEKQTINIDEYSKDCRTFYCFSKKPLKFTSNEEAKSTCSSPEVWHSKAVYVELGEITSESFHIKGNPKGYVETALRFKDGILGRAGAGSIIQPCLAWWTKLSLFYEHYKSIGDEIADKNSGNNFYSQLYKKMRPGIVICGYNGNHTLSGSTLFCLNPIDVIILTAANCKEKSVEFTYSFVKKVFHNYMRRLFHYNKLINTVEDRTSQMEGIYNPHPLLTPADLNKTYKNFISVWNDYIHDAFNTVIEFGQKSSLSELAEHVKKSKRYYNESCDIEIEFQELTTRVVSSSSSLFKSKESSEPEDSVNHALAHI